MVIEAHPRLFSNLFAGTLEIPPVELRFKKPKENERPVSTRVKPLSPWEYQIVQQWVEKSLKEGKIQDSASVWRLSMFPGKKPD